MQLQNVYGNMRYEHQHYLVAFSKNSPWGSLPIPLFMESGCHVNGTEMSLLKGHFACKKQLANSRGT